jgi:hypothetical protein
MQTPYFLHFSKIIAGCWLGLNSFVCLAQTTYLHQNFSKTGSLINPLPDTSQFSHIILTAPALSFYKLHKGYLELTRTQQDSATGGIIRVLRATPFSPNPETLFIQIRLSAESIQSGAVNAIYCYVGEQFDPVNNSFPANGLMFGRFIINFGNKSFSVKDPETQSVSEPIDLKKMVTLTWALNNSMEPFRYRVKSSGRDEIASPGTYDLWVDDQVVQKGSNAYPGNSAFSPAKLSNFEIRYRNGLGRIHIHEILIADGNIGNEFAENVVAPNPVVGQSFLLRSPDVDPQTVRMMRQNGQRVAFKKIELEPGKVEISLERPCAAGIYILGFRDRRGKEKFARVAIE